VTINWWQLLLGLAPVVSRGIVTVLHSTGADKHKTIAGDVAQGLGTASALLGVAAGAAQDQHTLLNGVQAQATVQTATAGGAA
jgi:hypothetical protein